MKAIESVHPFLAVLIRAVVFFPVGLGLVIAALNFSFYRSMVASPLGVGFLAGGVACIAVTVVLCELAVLLVRRRRTAIGMGLAGLAFLASFVTVWLVLLAPALVVAIGANS